MIEHSSKSKGYLPMKSGPNMMGFDMGKSGSLMEMMQTGGQPSRGAAMLARSRQRQSDIKKLEDQQRAEAKRQKRGGLFGSIGGLAGGLIGAALAPVTGGASLALASGLGTALGKGLGERFGAGKAVDYDSSGTVFAQQDFRDVDEASADFNKGMLERAGVAGLKAAATAGLSPNGGIYGTARAKAGGLRSSLADLAGFGGAPLPVAPSVERVVQAGAPFGDPSLFSDKIFDPSSVFSASTYNPMTSPADALLGASDYIPETFSLTQAVPVPQFYEDGGLIEYQYGGGVGDIQQILQDAGIQANENQLALFEQFNPSSLNELASGLQSSLLSGTQQSQQQQAGMGFAGSGAIQQAQAQQRESAMDQLTSAQEQAARQFESQTLGQAASMIDQDAKFGTYTAPPPTVSSLPSDNQGDVMFNGSLYQWNPTVNQYEIVEDQDYDYSEYEEFG
tara:strand:- start:6955 stop:8304 length:1350 start_codon:yes stop_codon:yes gene_type:complete